MTTNTVQSSGSNVRNPELFKALMKNLVEEIASSVSQEEFQDVLKTLDGRPAVLSKLFEMQKSAIVNDLQQDIDYLFRENHIDDKYNEITKLALESPADHKAWRPQTGDCEAQLHAYRVQSLLSKKDKLEALVKKERIVRMLSKNDLDKKRDIIRNNLSNIADAKSQIHRFYDTLHTHINT